MTMGIRPLVAALAFNQIFEGMGLGGRIIQAGRGGIDEPFAWDSREYLRKLCIGKQITFRFEYVVPSIGREFGSVYLGYKNVAALVVSEGWAKVIDKDSRKGKQFLFLLNCYVMKNRPKNKGWVDGARYFG